jgi:hypothetical protein
MNRNAGTARTTGKDRAMKTLHSRLEAIAVTQDAMASNLEQFEQTARDTYRARTGPLPEDVADQVAAHRRAAEIIRYQIECEA